MFIRNIALFALLRPFAAGENVRGRKLALIDECKDSTPTLSDPIAERLLYNSGGLDAWISIIKGAQGIGSCQSLIPEANDADATGATIKDGESGDTGFPHGDFKTLATVGEYDVCTGQMIVGVPDGIGAYLPDDSTVRVVVQSESYGPVKDGESYPFSVNDGVTFTGSHVQYIDYNRKKLAKYMSDYDKPASTFVEGFGELIETVYNLNGELVGPRNRDGPTTTGAHFSNTDAEGNWVIKGEPKRADWHMQSLCAAHLEEKYNWGDGIGFEDDIFLTNEEWMHYDEEGVADLVGLSAHAIDIDEKTIYAIGSVTNTGFEKIIEINPMHKDYIVLAPAGYNGAFDNVDPMVEKKNELFGLRADGKNWTKPENIVPARIYIGVKGLMEDGSKAPSDDFLARNGLRYGKMYGFAIDMSENGPSSGLWRDEFHKDPEKGVNGAKVPGEFQAIKWQWGGVATDFTEDGAWDFQDEFVTTDGMHFWNAKGYDEPGCKMEHNSPDIRPGKSGFVQGSTCGYFGHYYLTDIKNELAGLDPSAGELPPALAAEYYVYQGELPIVDQIELGGAGIMANGEPAYKVYHGENMTSPDIAETFEDIDGLEVILTKNNQLHAIIQEDAGNWYGDRMFITSPLTHDGTPITYYFVAMSGGKKNTRMTSNVGVPAGTNQDSADAHEFSGIFDASPLLHMNAEGNFVLDARDYGYKKNLLAGKVKINQKTILINLQASSMKKGPIEFFNADRGGQWLAYKPKIPM